MANQSARNLALYPPGVGRTVDLAAILRLSGVALPLVLAFTLSPSTLIALGDVGYILPGAAVYEKIHPATYACLFSLICYVVFGHARKVYTIVFAERPILAWYFVGALGLFVYAAVLLSVPFVQLVDTYLFPGLLLILLVMMSRSDKVRVCRILDALFIVNSLIGLYEVSTGARLVPVVIWSSISHRWMIPQDWRASALMGHPLTNAYVTGCYVLDVLMTRRIASTPLRLAIVGLHVFALFAFASRAATLLVLLFTLAYLSIDLLGVLRKGRIKPETAVLLSALGIAAIALPILLSTGIADRFIERFTHDKGSAVARDYMMDMIGTIPLGDLVFGQDAQLTYQLLKRYNIVAIESYWLSFLVTFGIIGCLIMWPALVRIVQCVAHYAGKGSYAVMGFFFLCNSTSTGMGTKTMSFGLVIAICMTHGPRLSPGETARAIAPPRAT